MQRLLLTCFLLFGGGCNHVLLPEAGAESEAPGLGIYLVRTGELIIADSDILFYDNDFHRIQLTPAGAKKWNSFVLYDNFYQPPIPKLGGLFGEGFCLTLAGEEIYRGTIWSLVSSRCQSGILLGDALGAFRDQLWLRLEGNPDQPTFDPRTDPRLLQFFNQQGKLR